MKGCRTLPASIQYRWCDDFSRGEHWHHIANHIPKHIQSVQGALESGHSDVGVESSKAIQEHQSDVVQRLVFSIPRLHSSVSVNALVSHHEFRLILFSFCLSLVSEWKSDNSNTKRFGEN